MLKDQLFKTSGLQFGYWLFGPDNFLGLLGGLDYFVLRYCMRKERTGPGYELDVVFLSCFSSAKHLSKYSSQILPLCLSSIEYWIFSLVALP